MKSFVDRLVHLEQLRHDARNLRMVRGGRQRARSGVASLSDVTGGNCH
jgi:hypothetical protein